MLHTISGDLIRATVVKRPSASIKSPYVADIVLEDGTTALCHTPSLGCCGLVERDRIVYVIAAKEGSKSKTAYTVQIAECSDNEGIYYVGIHPMVSQNAARSLLQEISSIATWKSEVKLSAETRIDYVGTLPNNKKIYVEVKTAPVSIVLELPRNDRYAVFPEGYRKKITDTISPRAVKHAYTLKDLLSQETTEACILLYMVPRNDCVKGLKINTTDPIYHTAVTEANNAGVQLKAYSLDYALDGTIHKNCEIDVIL
jgi:DNA-binding sugar fermentation-stimulating protein